MMSCCGCPRRELCHLSMLLLPSSLIDGHVTIIARRGAFLHDWPTCPLRDAEGKPMSHGDLPNIAEFCPICASSETGQWAHEVLDILPDAALSSISRVQPPQTQAYDLNILIQYLASHFDPGMRPRGVDPVCMPNRKHNTIHRVGFSLMPVPGHNPSHPGALIGDMAIGVTLSCSPSTIITSAVAQLSFKQALGIRSAAWAGDVEEGTRCLLEALSNYKYYISACMESVYPPAWLPPSSRRPSRELLMHMADRLTETLTPLAYKLVEELALGLSIFTL